MKRSKPDSTVGGNDTEMPRFEVEMKITADVSAHSRKAAREHIMNTVKGSWWQNTVIGFSNDRFRADCKSVEIVKMRRK